jgi:hypothetical protein
MSSPPRNPYATSAVPAPDPAHYSDAATPPGAGGSWDNNGYAPKLTTTDYDTATGAAPHTRTLPAHVLFRTAIRSENCSPAHGRTRLVGEQPPELRNSHSNTRSAPQEHVPSGTRAVGHRHRGRGTRRDSRPPIGTAATAADNFRHDDAFIPVGMMPREHA